MAGGNSQSAQEDVALANRLQQQEKDAAAEKALPARREEVSRLLTDALLSARSI